MDELLKNLSQYELKPRSTIGRLAWAARRGNPGPLLAFLRRHYPGHELTLKVALYLEACHKN